jgi:hypothetical protein
LGGGEGAWARIKESKRTTLYKTTFSFLRTLALALSNFEVSSRWCHSLADAFYRDSDSIVAGCPCPEGGRCPLQNDGCSRRAAID